MRRGKLDIIDRKILSQLQVRGRMTNVELAEHAGISAPPCLRRLRALEEDGIIQGYHAQVNVELLDFKITAFIQVKLNSSNDHDLRAFEQEMQKLDYVRECHLMAGDYDALLRVVAHSWDEYQKFLTQVLVAIPLVAQTKSAVALRRSKYLPGVPIDVYEKKKN